MTTKAQKRTLLVSDFQSIIDALPDTEEKRVEFKHDGLDLIFDMEITGYVSVDEDDGRPRIGCLAAHFFKTKTYNEILNDNPDLEEIINDRDYSPFGYVSLMIYHFKCQDDNGVELEKTKLNQLYQLTWESDYTVAEVKERYAEIMAMR